MIIQDGIKRMYGDGEERFYYITVMNEQYEMPAMPEGVRDGIIKGLYRFTQRAGKGEGARRSAQLLGSGAILNEVVKAQEICSSSTASPPTSGARRATTSSIATRTRVERWNLLHPTETAAACRT